MIDSLQNLVTFGRIVAAGSLSAAARELGSGIDLAIRFGTLADSSMIAQELAPNFRVLCASPGYIGKYGVPAHPGELSGHRCIVIGRHSHAEWRFEGMNAAAVRVRGTLMTNDGDAAHAWALEGVGIALKSIWDVGG
ncbi:LysR substrate-binding domain-containing protein [Burkholderia sp. WAC0059]|uniref:LysR substrate-binding domain-containing protein n=1 Tax=Burkholderia sp. WAC0059 TaxID=2066022 RepID=UPI002687CDC6